MCAFLSQVLLLILAGAVEAAEPVTRPADCAIDDVSYGELLPIGEPDVQVWWCDATRKVGRRRPAPTEVGRMVRLEAARNEFEAVQVVVRPRRDLKGLKAKVTYLAGGRQARIAGSDIELLRVRYVRIHTPTDKTGVADEWPDPLPPLDKPIDVPAGINQPIWVLVHVPASAPAGDYLGVLRLTAEGWSASVPLKLHVWDFVLPHVPYTQSGFGLSEGTIARYHGLKTEADRRAVFAKYMQSFANHRISPYDPAPFDDMRIRFLPDAEPPRVEVDFDRFDQAMQEAFNRFNISSFVLRIPGMGGGTFHERREGELGGHRAGTPAYEAMFSSMVRQIQDHLAARGWLERAYVYWFDEPEPRDYEFVRAGMERLHRHAPKIRRMLTEEPVEALFGAVDLWCPVTPNYKHEIAEQRRAAGEHFWWYICTGPKAPFCTLFIDKPATELRVWLWQTWQRRIEGILIWQTNWWTSPEAYPDGLQNPYEDPMSWQSGYGIKSGDRRPWGNGDGRFLYPPEAAAAGPPAGGPVLDGPVGSLRWEMLREGIEDVDYLHILRRAIEANVAGADADLLARARSLLEVPESITKDMTHFTKDSRPIYERRRAIAEMIERLTVPRAR